MATNQRLYNVQEYAAKAKAALAQLEATQRPGEKNGKGSKAEVLNEIKADIIALLGKGFTVQQVSAALKEDVFSILPKTITELVNNKRRTRSVKSLSEAATPGITARRAVSLEVVNQPAHAPKRVITTSKKNATSAAAGAGSFRVREDKKV